MGGRDHSEECPYCHVWHGGLNETPCSCVTVGGGIVQRAGARVPGERFSFITEEALAAQDGKTVPLTLEPGGPVIGEATLHYSSGEKALKADFRVADPKVAEILRENPPNIFG